MIITYDNVNVGDKLAGHVSGPVSRHVLALYCGGSGDHNPLHVDSDFAKSLGMPDVIAHGMLSMAFLAQLLTRWVPQSQIRSWGVRFVNITPTHVRVICSGAVIEKFQENGERLVRLAINTHTDSGLHTLTGDAVIALP